MKKPQSILAVHSGALGDVVLFGHLLRELGGRVTLAAGREKAQVLRDLGVVHAGLDFDSLPMHEIFTDTPPSDCRLATLLGRHDRLVSCFPGDDLRAQQRLSALCGATVASFLPVRPPASWSIHLLDLWRDLIDPRPGHFSEPGEEAWRVPPEWRKEANEKLSVLGIEPSKPYALIHPGAGSEAKCWPLDRFTELASLVPQAIFALGPVEQDRWPARQVEGLRGRWPVLLDPPLSLLAAVAAEAWAFAGNDSGASHLAAALGAPTVALFGPTRSEHFAPRGRKVKIIAAGSMADISVHAVAETLGELAG